VRIEKAGYPGHTREPPVHNSFHYFGKRFELDNKAEGGGGSLEALPALSRTISSVF